MSRDFPLFRMVWAGCWAAVLLIAGPIVAVIIGRRRGWSGVQKVALGLGIVAVGLAAVAIPIVLGAPR